MALNRTNPLPRTMATVLENLADNPEFGDVYTKTQTDTLLTDKADKIAVLALTTAPAAADSTGVAGQVAFDATNLYECIATDTWVKATLATWA